MLTDLDPRVRAHLNLHAVLGSLPLLAQRVPAAAEVLTRLRRPVTLRVHVRRGGPDGSLTFHPDRITHGPHPGAATARLLLASPTHFNRVIDGQAQPVPLAGPRGLAFLTGVFTPLTEVLAGYLEPSPEALTQTGFRANSTILTLRTVAAAVAVVANEDRSGQVSARHTPDGNLDLQVGEDLRYQLQVLDHHFALVEEPTQAPRAVLRFADLDTAGGVLSGELSTIAAVSDGRLSMRGMLSMVDNVNRILDRAGHYLRK